MDRADRGSADRPGPRGERRRPLSPGRTSGTSRTWRGWSCRPSCPRPRSRALAVLAGTAHPARRARSRAARADAVLLGGRRPDCGEQGPWPPDPLPRGRLGRRPASVRGLRRGAAGGQPPDGRALVPPRGARAAPGRPAAGRRGAGASSSPASPGGPAGATASAATGTSTGTAGRSSRSCSPSHRPQGRGAPLHALSRTTRSTPSSARTAWTSSRSRPSRWARATPHSSRPARPPRARSMGSRSSSRSSPRHSGPEPSALGASRGPRAIPSTRPTSGRRSTRSCSAEPHSA